MDEKLAQMSLEIQAFIRIYTDPNYPRETLTDRELSALQSVISGIKAYVTSEDLPKGNANIEIMDGSGDTTFKLTPQEAGDFVRDAMSLEDRPAVLIVRDRTL